MTTTAQIEAYAKKYIPDFAGVFAADQLPEPQNVPSTCSMILNYGNEVGNKIHGVTHYGFHWVAVLRRQGKYAVWADSMGAPPDGDDAAIGIRRTHFSRWLKRLAPLGVTVNRDRVQSYGSGVCGQWSLYFCMHSTPNLNPSAYRWLGGNTKRNDAKVMQLVKAAP